MFGAGKLLAAKRSIGEDPYFDMVALVLNMDGVLGSSVFTDKSKVPKTITKIGSPTVDGNNMMNVQTSSTLRLNANAAWRLAAGVDFCIEWFASMPSTAGVTDMLSNGTLADATQWTGLSTSAQFQFYPGTASNFTFRAGVVAATVQHFAVFRIGGTIYCSINGVVSPAGISWNQIFGSTTQPIYIGSRGESSGWMAAGSKFGPMRWTNGNARYPAAGFTPPAFGPFPTT